MRPFTSLLIIISLPLFFFPTHSGKKLSASANTISPSISNYCNSRFDFCVAYPAVTLPIQEVSVNDDGVILKTVDEKSTVSVNGSYNVTNWSAEEVFEFTINSITEEKEGQLKMISKIIGDHFYECYFSYDGCYYFNRCIFVDDYYISLLLTTPVNYPMLMQQLKKEVSVTFGNHG